MWLDTYNKNKLSMVLGYIWTISKLKMSVELYKLYYLYAKLIGVLLNNCK